MRRIYEEAVVRFLESGPDTGGVVPPRLKMAPLR
jgi:hypothetical protein